MIKSTKILWKRLFSTAGTILLAGVIIITVLLAYTIMRIGITRKRLFSTASTAFLTVVMIFTVFLAYGTIANRFYRVITIDGNSMAPTFYLGDQVIVLPPKAQTPPGAIVLLSVDSRLVTHRLLRYENGMPVTQGDANLVPDDFSNSRVRIVGTYWFHLPKVGYISLYIKQFAMRFRR